MPTKRAQKKSSEFGSIHYVESRGHYRVRITYRDGKTGETKSLERTRRTEAEAEELLDSLERQYSPTTAKRGVLSVLDLARFHVEEVRGNRRTATLLNYEQYLRIVASDPIGRMHAVEAGTPDFKAFYQRLATKYSSSVIGHVNAFLRQTYNIGMQYGYASRNPLAKELEIELPESAVQRNKRAEVEAWDAVQTRTFLESTAGDRFFPLWWWAVYSGQRFGELAALRLTDVDLDRGAVDVRQTLTRAGGGKFGFGPTKTQAGERLIALTPDAVEVLRGRLHQRELDREKAGSLWQEHGLVFCTSIGTPFNPRNVFRELEATIRRLKETNNDVPMITLHKLRSTSATLYGNAQYPDEYLRYRLGHATKDITDHYRQKHLRELKAHALTMEQLLTH